MVKDNRKPDIYPSLEDHLVSNESWNWCSGKMERLIIASQGCCPGRWCLEPSYYLSTVKVTEWFRPTNDKGHFATWLLPKLKTWPLKWPTPRHLIENEMLSSITLCLILTIWKMLIINSNSPSLHQLLIMDKVESMFAWTTQIIAISFHLPGHVLKARISVMTRKSWLFLLPLCFVYHFLRVECAQRASPVPKGWVM